MTQQEQWIEALRSMDFIKAHNESETLVVDAIDYGKLADQIIAKGAIMPPCKVGDIVYLADDSTVETAEVVAVTEDKLGLYVSIRQNVDGMSIDDEMSEELFGKTVFLTREEAEKAIKERETK